MLRASITTVERAALSKSKEEVDALGWRVRVLRAIPIVIWLRRVVVVRIAATTSPVAAAASPVAASSVITTASSMVAAATAAMTTAAAVAAAATAVAAATTTAGISRSDSSEAANHEGKADSRRNPDYLRAQFFFRFERYLHRDTTSRDRLPLHFAAVCFAAEAFSRLRNKESAVFFCASDIVS